MNPDTRELAARFDIEKPAPEFYADPYLTYRALREYEPVKRMPNGSWDSQAYPAALEDRILLPPTRDYAIRRR